MTRFIELTAGREPPGALVEAVYRETEGNPFFVHEVVHLLQSDGRLDRAEEMASWSLEIPQGVRQVVGHRLLTLSEECNRVLAVASVIGREFELQVLAEVAEVSEEKLVELLEEAERNRIVGEPPGTSGTYRFSHALIRETLYDEIRTTRRLRLHRRIAEVIETLFADKLEPHLAQLAYQFCEAAAGGDVDKAIEYAVRAAQREERMHANEEAAGHYERAISALEAADPVDESQRCKLLLALGNAQLNSGTIPQFRQTFRRALALARERELPEQFARAALWLEHYLPNPGVVNEEHAAALEEALSLLGDEDSALRAELMARLAVVLLWHKLPERRERLCHEAIEVARRVGDRALVGHVLGLTDYVVGRRNDPAEQLAVAEQVFAIGEELGDENLKLHSYTGSVEALIHLAEGEALDRSIEAYQQQSEKLRNAGSIGWAWIRRAARALSAGKLAEAARLSQKGLALYQRVDPELASGVFGAQMFVMLRMQGRVGETVAWLREGMEKFPERSHVSLRPRSGVRRDRPRGRGPRRVREARGERLRLPRLRSVLSAESVLSH